jgi:predicted NAD/FAD-binding protein
LQCTRAIPDHSNTPWKYKYLGLDSDNSNSYIANYIEDDSNQLIFKYLEYPVVIKLSTQFDTLYAYSNSSVSIAINYAYGKYNTMYNPRTLYILKPGYVLIVRGGKRVKLMKKSMI